MPRGEPAAILERRDPFGNDRRRDAAGRTFWRSKARTSHRSSEDLKEEIQRSGAEPLTLICSEQTELALRMLHTTSGQKSPSQPEPMV